MASPQPDHTNEGSSLLPMPSRFQVHLDKLHKQEVKIQQLEHDKLEQAQRINDLAEQLQRSGQERADLEIVIAKLRRELAQRQQEGLKAARIIDVLTRQAQAAQEMTTRAEKAQRDAEADYILRHFVEDGDGNSDLVTVEQLQSELARKAYAEQQSSRRVSELEEEITWTRDVAETLSRELQESKDTRNELELRLQKVKDIKTIAELELQQTNEAKNEAEHDLEETKDAQDAGFLPVIMNVKAAAVVNDDSEHWKAMASVCQNLVTALRAQVKTLTDDKEKLESAFACCQRSADNRLKALDQDRQNIEEENIRLRAELAQLRQDVKAMEFQFLKFEKEDYHETLVLEGQLITRLSHAQVHQKELAARIQEMEHKLAASADTTSRSRQLVAEKNELLQQLEEERCHSKDLACSTATFKKATETALKQLKDAELELRAFSRSHDANDEQHDTVAGLARLVITDLKRQQDESVESAVALMQVLHLTSSLETHLNHLRALRETQDMYSSSMRNSDSDSDAGGGALSAILETP